MAKNFASEKKAQEINVRKILLDIDEYMIQKKLI
jgi:hypothetical protein